MIWGIGCKMILGVLMRLELDKNEDGDRYEAS